MPTPKTAKLAGSGIPMTAMADPVMPSISSPPTEGLKAPNTEIVPPEGRKGAAKPTQASFAPEVPTMMSAAENPNTGVVGGGVTPRARSTNWPGGGPCPLRGSQACPWTVSRRWARLPHLWGLFIL
jgi:hypothetical protein